MAAPAKAKGLDRSRVMKRAAVARKKRRNKKAISLYRQILAEEPDNPDLHKKIAPLLAMTRQNDEALASYRAAAEGFVKKGFTAQAIGLLRAAAVYLPRETILWQNVAELEASRGRVPDAVRALVEGRSHFRSRRQRPQAIQLLRLARRLDAKDFPLNFDLACLLAKTGNRRQAVRMLDELAASSIVKNLRRVRARQFRIAPSPTRAWLLVRVWLLRR
jgi:tetratricopeptide (TPR) repeat protein